MQGFIIALLISSISMSLIALLYKLTAPLIFRRYTKRWGYYIWMIIIIGFLIPFRPEWGNAIFSIDMFLPVESYFVDMTGVLFVAETQPQSLMYTAADAVAIGAANYILWWQVTFAVWLIGAALFLAYHIIRHFLFMKTVRRWSEEVTDSEMLSLYQKIKSEMGIKRPIPLYLCPFGSPMMTGIIKPLLFLPANILAEDELGFVLRHELVHYKRKDLPVKYLIMGARAVHWFNPVISLVAKATYTLCEESCDTEVVQNTDIDTRQSYSETLIGVVKCQSKLKTAFSTNFYRGKKGMKSRISSIMDTGKKRAGTVIAGLVLMLMIGTGFVFTGVSAVAQVEEEPVQFGMIHESEWQGFYTNLGDMELYIYRAEDVVFEHFTAVYEVDHSVLWETPDFGERMAVGASQPIYNVSLIHFTHYHDRVTNEDLFIQTESLGITDVLAPDEVILIYNFASPDFVPWSIISFYDIQGQRHFFTIGHDAGDSPHWFVMLGITDQIRFE